jgi:hypothetical protein
MVGLDGCERNSRPSTRKSLQKFSGHGVIWLVLLIVVLVVLFGHHAMHI